MKNKLVAVLDFGSSKISVLVGSKSTNNGFNIMASENVDYAGFMQGKFLLERSLFEEIALCLNTAQLKLNEKIDRLFVSVPAEFCFNAIEELEIDFKIPTKIKQKQLDLLLEKIEGLEFQDKTLISKAPIEYLVNNEKIVFSPIGKSLTSLKCKISEMFVSDYFISLISNLLDNLQIDEYNFISPEQIMGSYLLEQEERADGAIIVDVGYITTSIAVAKGEGLTNLRAFSMGGGHITSDLAEVLKINYDLAEELKRKLILTIRPNAIDVYELSNGDSINMQTVNEIAFARIDSIINAIEKCLKKINELDNAKPIYLTGGGISYIKGIRCYLREKLNREIKLIAPAPLQLHKYELSSAVAVFNIACDFAQNLKKA